MSSPVVPVLLQFVVVVVITMFIISTSPTNASPAGKLQLRGNHLDSTRFFLPDALLADRLLSSAGPIHSFRPAVFDRSLSSAKRYFDSLAGQSLGKRSAPRVTAIGEDAGEVSRGDNDDERVNARRTMRLNALRPGWQMW